MVLLIWGAVCTLLTFTACQKKEGQDQRESADSSQLADVPAWADRAVYYEVLVDRFRNGDRTNDPTVETMQGNFPGQIPDNWEVTPWTRDWYRQVGWELYKDNDFYSTAYLRRYGGDLQGVINKLDYIQQLGANTLLLMPLNESPSLRKYNATAYHHIDPDFGPDPEGDRQLISSEDPADPATWQWTAADKMFLQLLQEAHRREIRVVMGYNWNYTSRQFWAWEDVKERQQDSPYGQWYEVESWDESSTEADEFAYEGWMDNPSLPEWKELPVEAKADREGVDFPDGLKEHLFAVARRWISPEGSGIVRGIDGICLYKADSLPQAFLKDYRMFVKSTKQDVLLIGEVGQGVPNDSEADLTAYCQGDMFDAVVNYEWGKLAYHFFAQTGDGMKPSTFVRGLKRLMEVVPKAHLNASLNVVSNSNTPRLSSLFYNRNRLYGNKGKAYKVEKPSAIEQNRVAQLLCHQYLFFGAPHIWNGNELGMWGTGVPDNMKPMVWNDFSYEEEKGHPTGWKKKRDRVYFDELQLQFYERCIDVRKRIGSLADAKVEFVVIDDERMTLVYRVGTEEREVVAAFNLSDTPVEISLDLEGVFVGQETGQKYYSQSGKVSFRVSPMYFKVLISSSSARGMEREAF